MPVLLAPADSLLVETCDCGLRRHRPPSECCRSCSSFCLKVLCGTWRSSSLSAVIVRCLSSSANLSRLALGASRRCVFVCFCGVCFCVLRLFFSCFLSPAVLPRREHRQLELETFLQLPGQSLSGAVGSSPRRGPWGAPLSFMSSLSAPLNQLLERLQRALPRMSCTVTHVQPTGPSKTLPRQTDLRPHTKWTIVAKKRLRLAEKRQRLGGSCRGCRQNKG